MENTRAYRAIFISDIHLATRGCKADFLLDFLKHHESEHLYLIGDIIDGWQLKRSVYWPQAHNDVIQKLLRKARKGTAIHYLIGNHDEGLRGYLDVQFGGISMAEEAVHQTADGRRFLVLHGDKFDGVVRHSRWLALLGDRAYHAALWFNHWLNVARRSLGFSYWSLSAFLKEKVKNAVAFVTSFKLAIADEAHRRGFDGIICGHIHQATIQPIDDILYCNSGDWIESCTALVEHHDGRLEIIQWARAEAPAGAING